MTEDNLRSNLWIYIQILLILITGVLIGWVAHTPKCSLSPYNAFREAIISNKYIISSNIFSPLKTQNYTIIDSVLSSINSSLFITSKTLADMEAKDRTIYALTTGYNTLKEQTDSSPCVSASGDNICGRKDVAACPRSIELGTLVKINGKYYYCLDRLNIKYDNRFDISFDKDLVGAINYGQQYHEVTIYEQKN
jgi:3D (Asp-Asp-Asp) domain-containing protein